ncbi:unnamed protein product [Owenia fusiformis]|uniref:DNA-directed primase/polymerase protein n=1 Tax=Owenia fusiformis TaxID=6347 RepID=A0A8J1TBJ6_OWEFU|nr:unnamed protein product [Owenia fusiformis]
MMHMMAENSSVLISGLSFYSTKNKKQVEQRNSVKRKLEERETNLKKHVVPTPYKCGMFGESPVWESFYSQEEAFKRARQYSKSLHVFANESKTFVESTGKRTYFVTSYDQFWHVYKQLALNQRCYYEIIPHEAVCKLYFDLEFNRALNPTVNDVKMMDTFLKLISEQLKHVFNIDCNPEDIIDLDASTDAKFSRHLIYVLKDVAFQNNIEAGKFVKYVCQSLLDTIRNQIQDKCDTSAGTSFQTELSISDLEGLLVNDKHGHSNLFCDTGVYTKNRNFRLYLSSKRGKNNHLRLSKWNKYSPKPTKTTRDIEKRIFLDSLIANVKYTPNLKLLTFNGPGLSVATVVKDNNSSIGDHSTLNNIIGYKSSPYPEIDTYVGSIINKGGVQGQIRRWTYFSSGELIVYDIIKNRYCENINRAHKSNNIIIVADLKAGVIYQKCHDPECRDSGFKSQNYPIPPEYLPANYFLGNDSDFFDDIEDDMEISDADLVEAVAQIEHLSSSDVTNKIGDINNTQINVSEHNSKCLVTTHMPTASSVNQNQSVESTDTTKVNNGTKAESDDITEIEFDDDINDVDLLTCLDAVEASKMS